MAKLNEWMGRTQVMGPLQRQAAIDAGAMTKEDFMDTPPPQTQASPPVGGSSAQADKAKAMGITVEELRRRQDAQFQELMKKRQGKAKGGKLGMEHTHSSTQDQSIDDKARTSRDSIKRGMQQWVPDLVGLPGDLADALAFAARKVARGQSEKSVPSLGAGAALRRMVSRAPLRGESTLSDPDTPVMEEATRFLNPLMMTSPTKLVKSPLALAALAAATGDGATMFPAMAGIIKPKGGNWLEKVGSPEQALKGLLRHADDPQLREALMRAGRDHPAETEAGMARALAMDNWIKGPLTQYLKRDFASESDPIRKLADQGILHFNPGWVADAGDARRRADGYVRTPIPNGPGSRLGKTRLGQDWEDLADSSVSTQLSDEDLGYLRRKENPWISKLPPGTPLHQISREASILDDLGLKHLTDEVYNSLNEGRITPQQLSNGSFSVEAAVRHVAERNALAQKAAEKAQLEAMKSAVTTKEYPNGFRWAEIPDTKDPAALALCKATGKAGGWCTGDDWAAEEYGSGGGKLHVLLDKDGRPHAQVHVGKPDITERLDSLYESLPYDEAEGLEGLSQPEMLKKISETSSLPTAQKAAQRLLDEWENSPAQITQIKPRANSWESQMVKDKLAEDPEYRNTITPMLQDFVKSGQWGQVDDLSNAEMWKHPKTGAYHTKAEAEADEALDAVYSSRNLDDEGNYRPNYADGGLVNFDDLAAFLAPR